MQLNGEFSLKNSKKNDDILKSASFFNKFESKENKEQQRPSKKKDSTTTEFSIKAPTQLTFGPKIKHSKPHEEEYDDERDKLFKQLLTELGFPTEYPNYSSSDYWNNRYANEKGEVNEWLVEYDVIRSTILNLLKRDYGKEIMVIGCGNSRMSESLYNEGYRNITNIDFSQILIEEMNQKYFEKEEMEFSVMDACELEYPENCFDLIIDKGTFDCVLSGDSSFEKASAMINGIYMSLKNEGSFVCVSHGSPDTRVGYLQNKQYMWTLKIMEIKKNKIEQLKNIDEETQYYVYICIKN